MTLLVCPLCTGDLSLKVETFDGNEIMEGDLTCRHCRALYPIRQGVPRFVDQPTYAESFSYEWHRFRTVQLDSANGTRESETAFARRTGLAPDDVRGRRLLDAGIGAGRYAEVVAEWGGEVVGVEISNAVDAAFLNLARHPSVHLVQADIFSLPFRPESFDIAYSIGVRHHTPAPARALPRALSAIEAADLVVIGPGSLYTRLIPTLLVKDIADGIAHSHARVVLVANLMTEPGETDGYAAVDHLEAIRRHAPQIRIHDVLLNTAPIPETLAAYYAALGAVPVFPDTELPRALGCRPVERDLLGPSPMGAPRPRKAQPGHPRARGGNDGMALTRALLEATRRLSRTRLARSDRPGR